MHRGVYFNVYTHPSGEIREMRTATQPERGRGRRGEDDEQLVRLPHEWECSYHSKHHDVERVKHFSQ